MTTPDGTVAYQYDPAGQLLGATYSTGQPDEAYSYDANGNRVTANGAAYVTGPNNQLLFDGTYWYAYDPEGNRTARFIDANGNGVLDAGDTGVTTYAWDHRNRLTRVTDYDVYGDAAVRAVDYLYDVENRWIGRDVDLGANGQIDTRTRFAYDGNQIVLQFDGADMDDPADPLSVEDLSHRYLWNPAAVDQLMADEHVTDPAAAGSILWPLTDHLGTIRDLAAHDPATGTTTVVNHRTFDAYGNLLSQTNPAHDTLFAFTARPLDHETGLQNNLHRWYDAKTGRWMSEDPIGFEGKDGNLFAYVGNGPVYATDPMGLFVAFLHQPDPSGKTWLFLADEAQPHEFIVFVDVDGVTKWSIVGQDEHDGRRVEFDYNWLRRDEPGTITIWTSLGQKYDITYSPEKLVHRDDAWRGTWTALAELGVYFTTAQARVHYVKFDFAGDDFALTSDFTPAVFDSTMIIEANWTYNNHRGKGIGRLSNASSVFGTDRRDRREGELATTAEFTPPPDLQADRRFQQAPSIQSKHDLQATASLDYWALVDQWFIVLADPANDPFGGNATLTVDVALAVDTGAGTPQTPRHTFTFMLPGRPRADHLPR